MTSERRLNTRENVNVAAEIVDEQGKVRTALTRDVSPSGLQLLTRARLDDGQTVTLRLYLPTSNRTLDVTGKVVRHQELSADEKGTWRTKMAFHFDDAQPELAEEVKALAAEQAKVYGES